MTSAVSKRRQAVLSSALLTTETAPHLSFPPSVGTRCWLVSASCQWARATIGVHAYCLFAGAPSLRRSLPHSDTGFEKQTKRNSMAHYVGTQRVESTNGVPTIIGKGSY